MEYGESAVDLVRDGDLDVRLSVAFLLQCSLRSYVEIRELIEEHLEDKKGERVIHGTGSSVKLFIVKEDDYELLQEVKQQRRNRRY